MKRALLILSPLLFSLAVLIAVYNYFEVQIKNYLIATAVSALESNTPLRMTIRNVELEPLSLGARAEGISVSLPNLKGGEARTEVHVSRIRAHLDLLQLLSGRLFLSTVNFDELELPIDLDQSLEMSAPGDKGSSGKAFDIKTALHPIFENLKFLPVYRVTFRNSKIAITSFKHQKLELDLAGLDMIAFNQVDKLLVRLDVAEGSASSEKLPVVPFQLRTEFSLTDKVLSLDQIDFRALDSQIRSHGELRNLDQGLENFQGEVQIDTELHLSNWVKDLAFDSSWPVLKGTIESRGTLHLAPKRTWTGEVQVTGRDLKVGSFQLGNVQLTGRYKDGVTNFGDIVFDHPAGELQVKNLEMEIPVSHLESGIHVKGKLETDMIDLHDMLLALGVGDLDLDLSIAAQVQCEGVLGKDLSIQCAGDTTGDDFEVRSGPKSPGDTIAAFDEMSAHGDFTITSHEIQFKAQLETPNGDKGNSQGTINYTKGFDVQFSSPDLHLSSITNLANLKVEGHGDLSGRTTGDAHSAELRIKMGLHDGYFEDFLLGDVNGEIRYKAGILGFNDLQGLIGNTHYVGDVQVFLHDKKLSADIQSPDLELADGFHALERKFKLPIDITGRGHAAVHVEGPFQIGALTYNVHVDTLRGTVGTDTYDSFTSQVEAVHGEVDFKKVLLKKGKSFLTLSGRGHPNGQVEIAVNADHFLLEESEFVAQIGGSITGYLNTHLLINGFILDPDLRFDISLTHFVIEDEEFADSKAKLVINKNSIEGSAQLFGQKLKTLFIYPLVTDGPFRLHLKADDWNYATLFTILGGGPLLNEYQASFTGQFDFESPKGGFFKSSGIAHIDKFLLQRGNVGLMNSGPMSLAMSNGTVRLKNFALKGLRSTDKEFITLGSEPFTSDNLDLHVDAQSHLRLFHIFLPFFEEFAGEGKISAVISGSVLQPQLLGSAELDSGYIKVKGLIHPFERLALAAQFSAKQVAINTITGSFANGSIQGSGVLEIESLQKLPLNLKFHLDGASLNIPEGIRTNGSGDFTVSGSWFPYLLSGGFSVASGMVSKEFAGDAGAGGVSQSVYLPKAILKNTFEPLLLDLNVTLTKPLQIKNELMEGAATGSLRVKGYPDNPTLLGQIQTEHGTKLIFKDKKFDVATGTAQFKDQKEINPEIYLTADARVTDYDVNLIVLGPVKNLQFHLTSVPPLSESDIVSLLALGVITTHTDKLSTTNHNDSQSSAMAVGEALISSTKLGKDLQNSFGVNLQLSNSYDDTKNVSTSKVSLVKKLSDKINLSATRIQSQQNSNEYEIRYNFNNNLSAVGSFEQREATEDANATPSASTINQNEQILGLDLQFKREFK